MDLYIKYISTYNILKSIVQDVAQSWNSWYYGELRLSMNKSGFLDLIEVIHSGWILIVYTCINWIQLAVKLLIMT